MADNRENKPNFDTHDIYTSKEPGVVDKINKFKPETPNQPTERIIIRISNEIPKAPSDPKVKSLDTAIKATTGQAIKSKSSERITQEAARDLWRRGANADKLESAIKRSSVTLNERDTKDMLNIVSELRKLNKAYPDITKKFNSRTETLSEPQINKLQNDIDVGNTNTAILENTKWGLQSQRDNNETYPSEYIDKSQKFLDELTDYANITSEQPFEIEYRESEISPPTVYTQTPKQPEERQTGFQNVISQGRSVITDAGKKAVSRATNVAKREGQRLVKQGLSKLATSAGPALAQAGLYVGAAVGIIIGALAWLTSVLITIFLWAIGFTVFVALILFIINSGAYIVPPGDNLTTGGGGGGYVPPGEGCPSGWPTSSGNITQGSYTNNLQCTCCVTKACNATYPCNGSHSTMEAIDIGSVYGFDVHATHNGVARTGFDSCIGNYVEIVSTCEGSEFFSQYAHLLGVSINDGQAVAAGTVIGVSGNEGTCTTGPHLHYRFQYGNLGNPSYPESPPYMMPGYTPNEVPIGCCTVSTCGFF